jgi:large subunit ribosomal protein L25
MTEYELLSEPREITRKKVRRLRVQGYVPGVLYGRETEPVNLQFVQSDLERMLKRAGTTNLISLQIGEGGEKRTALVRDIQYDVIRQTVEHVDFYQVVMTDKITTDVSIVLLGDAPIDSLAQGSVLQEMTSVEVECLPADLVSALEIDVSSLTKPGDTLTIKDLQVPDSITVLAHGDDLVVTTHAFRAEEEEVIEEVVEEAAEVEVVGEELEEAEAES